ncbi:hypothetical protein FM106_28215 [Brachybacterium faecium]|nr:hypothetical protein FM106_28215 [Brachybacterium faecium]
MTTSVAPAERRSGAVAQWRRVPQPRSDAATHCPTAAAPQCRSRAVAPRSAFRPCAHGRAP